MFQHNPILRTDGYKPSHYNQYPKGMIFSSCYFSARHGKFPETLAVGMQPFIKDYLRKRIEHADIQNAKYVLKNYGLPDNAFNEYGWKKIVDVYGGLLPVRILAVPEGTLVPNGVPKYIIESLDEELAWLPMYLETAAVRANWYPSNVATLSFNIKRIIKKYLEETSDDWKAEIMFKLHDFGGRGVSSSESARLGGMGHLLNFFGSDTLEAVEALEYYYPRDNPSTLLSASIPAMEHSTVSAHDHEEDAYIQFLDTYAKPGAIVAAVSDTRDIYSCVEHIWCGLLKDKVKSSGATLVIRPDSGNPTAVVLKVLGILESKVGMSTNSKGYKVLPSYFKVIQGDGISLDSIQNILYNMKLAGYSASNIAFGMGGDLLQNHTRDTNGHAQKLSYIMLKDGTNREVCKNPITDPGKASLAGQLDVVRDTSGKLIVIKAKEFNSDRHEAAMDIVYDEDGPKYYSLEEVRSLIDSQL